MVSESAGLEQKGELQHQLGATNAHRRPSCCWNPGPPCSPGFGLSLSQRGLEVQMEALLWRLEVPPNWREPAACLHSQARRGPAGNPLFRVPCPSVAFSNVPLKALMAPGLLLSFDMKRSPPRCFRAGCGIRQAPCIHMDGEAPMPPGLPPGALLEASQDYKLMFTGVHQTGSPAGRPGINLFCIVGACYFPAHQLATKPFSDFARAEQAQGEDRRNRGPGMEGLYIAQSRVTGDCQPCHP